MRDPEGADELEGLVDTYGLEHVVSLLSAICGQKAYHARTNWQDGELTKAWSKAAVILDKAANGLPELP